MESRGLDHPDVGRGRGLGARLSLRTRLLAAGAIFFGVLFATMAIGVIQAVGVIDQRRGPAPPGPSEWIDARTVYRLPSEIQRVFSFMDSPYSEYHSIWREEEGDDVASLFEPGGLVPEPGYEYVPHVIAFEDVPASAIRPSDLAKLAEYEEEGLVGLVFFAGELFNCGPPHTPWPDSAIAHLLPVEVVAEERVTGVEAGMRIRDKKLDLFQGIDFSSFRIHSITKVTPRPGARVAATAKIGGEEYPLLVWWEVNGARIVVWTGNFDDIYGWETGRFWETQGMDGGPLFAKKIIYFAAQRRTSQPT